MANRLARAINRTAGRLRGGPARKQTTRAMYRRG
jgi:hypothetical protein